MINNHLITGIPRSGTTLLTALLTQAEAVVFSEPDWLKGMREVSSNAAQFTAALTDQLQSLRHDIKNQQPVLMKTSQFKQGQPSNYYIRTEDGQIISDKSEQAMLIKPELSDGLFMVKSNAQFTACLAELIDSQQFKIYCVIRNPIAAVMSWRSLDIPVSHGNMKIAEKYHPHYLDFIAPAQSLLEKQVLMADWFFAEYQKHANQINIIKYEDLINQPRQVLSPWPFKQPIDCAHLNNKNQSKHYDLSEYERIKSCFEQSAHHYRHFYPQL